MVSNKVKLYHIAFLQMVQNKYGTVIKNVSVRQIAKDFGMNQQTPLNYIRCLERNGYLAIDKVSAYKWVITINVEKVNSVINGKTGI